MTKFYRMIYTIRSDMKYECPLPRFHDSETIFNLCTLQNENFVSHEQNCQHAILSMTATLPLALTCTQKSTELLEIITHDFLTKEQIFVTRSFYKS